MNFKALLILIVFFIITGCEPVGVMEYEPEEIEKEEEQKSGGGSTIKEMECDCDTTVYILKPVGKTVLKEKIY